MFASTCGPRMFAANPSLRKYVRALHLVGCGVGRLHLVIYSRNCSSDTLADRYRPLCACSSVLKPAISVRRQPRGVWGFLRGTTHMADPTLAIEEPGRRR